MTTIPPLIDVTDILDTDMVMVTHADGQTYKIAGSELNKRHKVIMASSTTVTGAPLKAGNPVRIYFTADITAVNATTTMQIKYNNVNYYVKVPKGGALANYVAFNLGGSPAVFKYVQAYTTLELLFDGTQFIIMCNPVVISGTNFSIYADGLKRVDEVTENSMDLVTSNAVAQKLAITTSSDSTPYSQRVNADKDKSFINKLIGASFAVNQLIKNGNFASTSDWNYNASRATFSVTGNVGKMSDFQVVNPFIQQSRTFLNTHKYLGSIEVGCNQSNGSIDFGLRDSVSARVSTVQLPLLTTSRQLVSAVFVADATVTTYCIEFRKPGYDSSTEVTFSNAYLIDLTQMFGSAIADRIYAMEQATAGSGIAWIKSFGFFIKDYYSTDEGSLQNVKPSAYKTSASVVKWFINRNVSSQYLASLYAEATLKPNTNYTLYFRGANGAGVYPNEYIFTTNSSFTLDGSLQSVTVKTKTELSYSSATRLNGGWGWIIFKNRQGNTVVPNFTEFYIVEEGVNSEPSFSQSISLADTELRGIPKLDSNNNLYFDGDVYYPNGDVIRKYGVVDLGSFNWAQQDVEQTSVSSFWSNGIQDLVKPPSDNSLVANIVCSKYGAISWGNFFTSPVPEGIAILSGGQIRISDPNNTYNKNATNFKTAMSGIYLIYELATPTKETVAGYSNPHTLIRKGAEEFVDNRTIPLPVGHETEYAKLPSWLSDNSRFL